MSPEEMRGIAHSLRIAANSACDPSLEAFAENVRAGADALDALAKVRDAWDAHTDWQTFGEAVRAILDESASRPAPNEAKHSARCAERCNHCTVCGAGILYGSRCPKHYQNQPAAAPAPIEAREHICGSNLPSGRVIPPSECAACASEKTRTGEREALAGQIVEGHRQATERGVTSLKERIAFMADTILAAGFRRAPIEDAEPRAVLGEVRATVERYWADFEQADKWLDPDGRRAQVFARLGNALDRILDGTTAPKEPTEDAEPVAYEVGTQCRDDQCVYREPHDHGFACGPDCPCGEGMQAWSYRRPEERAQEYAAQMIRGASGVSKEIREQIRVAWMRGYEARAPYPTAPIEVTDEALVAAMNVLHGYAPPVTDIAYWSEGYRANIRAGIEAALKEMGKSA